MKCRATCLKCPYETETFYIYCDCLSSSCQPLAYKIFPYRFLFLPLHDQFEYLLHLDHVFHSEETGVYGAFVTGGSWVIPKGQDVDRFLNELCSFSGTISQYFLYAPMVLAICTTVSPLLQLPHHAGCSACGPPFIFTHPSSFRLVSQLLAAFLEYSS